MIKMYRAWALVVRHARLHFRDFSRFIWLFYWPLLDLVLWGFTGSWLQSSQVDIPNIAAMLLTAMIVWQGFSRVSLEVLTSLLDEIWSQNMMNLFSTPLKVSEWIIANAILSIATGTVVLLYCSLAAYFIYGINVLAWGLKLVPFLLGMYLAGIWVGCIGSGLIVYLGARYQSIAWIIGWIFAPFSGVFYPIDVLPQWAQTISKFLPMTYIFEGLRRMITFDSYPVNMVVIGLLLNCVYVALSLVFYKYMFKKSKEYGLARLVD